MKPLKIIELSFLSDRKSPSNLPNKYEAQFVDTWAGLIARRLKKFNPELDIETWRTKKDFNTVTEREVLGVKGVIWPYQKPVIKNILTYEMLKKLKEYSKEYFIILHYHNFFDIRFIILSRFILRNLKIVLTHHGSTPQYNRKFKALLFKLFLKKNNIEFITYLTPQVRDFIKRIKNHPYMKFMPVGADFEMHKQGDKIKAREKLGLDENKIYGIYVGSFFKLKSVDLIIDAYKKLKNKYNFSVIFVGGNYDKENDLYKEVVESGCPYFGIQNVTDMTDFYNAADFYIHPTFNPEFGGIDVAWMEALACNIPVISPKLSYLNFDYSEMGLSPVDYDDFLGKLAIMIETCRVYYKCREVSQKYLDGNTAIMKILNEIYEDIYRGYVKEKDTEKIKIFFIMTFSPMYEYITDDSTGNADKVWYNSKRQFLGIWKRDWAHIIGNRILITDKNIDYTVLRTDIRADKLFEHEFDTGLKHISFPSSKKNYLYGIKYSKADYSEELINYLSDLYNNGEKFVIVLPITRSKFFNAIMNEFYNKVPVINPHFTNNSYLMPTQKTLRKPFKYFHRLILNIQLKKLLNKVKNITLSHKNFKEQIQSEFKLNTIIYSVGFDPAEWKHTLDRITERRKFGIEDDKYMILLSSRLTPEKQIDKLILTLSKFKDENFVCYITGTGSKDYSNYLVNTVQKNGLSGKIRFTGYVPDEQLAKYYCASDVFIMSSIQEAGPGSTNIAVWYGVPIISTDTGFTSELLKENDAGIVVPTTDYAEWEKAFKRFFDGEYIKPLDKEILLQNKGAEVNIRRLIDLIKEVYNNFYNIKS